MMITRGTKGSSGLGPGMRPGTLPAGVARVAGAACPAVPIAGSLGVLFEGLRWLLFASGLDNRQNPVSVGV